MPKKLYIEHNTQIVEAKSTTIGELIGTTIDTTIVSSINSKNIRKKLLIRNKIHTNEFGNTRSDSWFIVFEGTVKKGITAYLDEALNIYNKL